MTDGNDNRDGLEPPPAFLEALARTKERLRQNPNWSPQTEYRSPYPAFQPMMSKAEYQRYKARQEDERRGLPGDPQEIDSQVVGQEEATPRPPVVRAALPVGQRIRDLRRALGWTQRDVAWQLGISTRSIIRYEQGRSSPVQIAPLRALRRLESAYAQELDD